MIVACLRMINWPMKVVAIARSEKQLAMAIAVSSPDIC